jgi:hypothetical protein
MCPRALAPERNAGYRAARANGPIGCEFKVLGA